MHFSLNQINKIVRFLFALAIILLPFNALPYFRNILREIAYEGTFYPLFTLMVIFGIMFLQGEKIMLPKHISFKILILFLFWILLSSSVNFFSIASVETKGRTGVEKFLLQFMLVIFVIITSLLIYNITVRLQEPLYNFRRFIMISFLIAGAYSLVEIAFLTGQNWAGNILQAIDLIIRDTSQGATLYFGRLRSVSGEASWFALYCSFALPWIFSYIFTARRYNIWLFLLISFYLLLLIILSLSRAAYVITIVQLFLFIFALFFSRQKSIQKGRIYALLLSLVVAIFIVTIGFKDSIFFRQTILDVLFSLISLENLSNVARIGSQITGFSIALDYPIFGVGLGQYGFYMADYVPDWAKTDEMLAWIDPSVGTPWAPVHGIYSRISCELGFVGLVIWLAIWLTVLYSCYKRYRLNSRLAGSHDILGLSLLISIIGMLLSGFNIDSFRFFGYWITLGVAWLYLSSSTSNKIASSYELKHRHS